MTVPFRFTGSVPRTNRATPRIPRDARLLALVASCVLVSCAAPEESAAPLSFEPRSYASDWGGYEIVFGDDNAVSFSIPLVRAGGAVAPCGADDWETVTAAQTVWTPSLEDGEPTHLNLVLPNPPAGSGSGVPVYFSRPGDWSELVMWPCDANQAGVHFFPVDE